MAAPSYGSVGLRPGSAAATSLTPGMPAGITPGDVLILACCTHSTETHSISGGGGGWAPLGTQTDSGSAFTVSLWWRIADGTESSPTVSWASAVGCGARIARYVREVDPLGASPFGTIGTPGTGTTSPHSADGFDTTRANSLVVYLGCAAANTGYGAVSGWTERSDAGSATGSSRHVFGDKTFSTAGTPTGTVNPTGANAAWVLRQVEITEPQVVAQAAGTGSASGAATASLSAGGTETTADAAGTGSAHGAAAGSTAIGAAGAGTGSAGGAGTAAAATGAGAAGAGGAGGAAAAAVASAGVAIGGGGAIGAAVASVAAGAVATGSGQALGAAASSVSVLALAAGLGRAFGAAVARVTEGGAEVGLAVVVQVPGRWRRHLIEGQWQRRTIAGRWRRNVIPGRWRQT